MDTKEGDFLDQAKKYIDLHLGDETFGVQALADHLGMDRSHMHRRLQQLKRMSASTWIRTARIDKAKELLSSEDMTASEVAYAVGFSSPQYFHKVFVKEVGITPGQFTLQSTVPETSTQVQTKDQVQDGQQRAASSSNSSRHWSVLIAILGLGTILWWGWKQWPTSKASHAPRVALIPFNIDSSSLEQTYFTHGISTEILNKLTMISEVDVVSNFEALAHQGQTISTADIGNNLDVDFVITGKSMGTSEGSKLMVDLVSIAEGKVIWSETYNQSQTDLFAIQGDITLQVAEQLRASVSDVTRRYLDRKPTTVMTAYDYLLRARDAYEHHRYSWNEKDLETALALYRQAIRIDSNLAEAYVGLGQAYLGGEFYAGANYGNRSSILDSILALSETAVNLDPDNYDALMLQGDVLRGQGKNEGSKSAYLQAATLRSNAPTTYEKLGLLATFEKAYDRAVINRLKALELDPKNPKRYMDLMRSYRDLNEVSIAEKLVDRALQLQPDYLYGLEMKGVLALETGRLSEALGSFKKMYALNPHDLWAKQQLATAYAWSGQYAEAVDIFQEMHDIITAPGFQRTPFTPFRGQTYGWALLQLGREEEARLVFNRELEWDEMNSAVHFNLTGQSPYRRRAAILGLLGQKQVALDLLEKSIYAPGSPFAIGWLKNDPLIEPLRNQPQYHQILTKYEKELAAMRNNIVPWRARTQELLANS